MSSVFGKNISFSIFGQSHSDAIGVVIDGLPAGEKLDAAEINRFMQRRAPGTNSVSTARKEADVPEILSGLVDDVTCGAPLCAVIRNTNTRSSDYDKLRDIPRPAHSDFPAHVKYGGFNDIRGGGHFSGRLTAPLCFAGAVCIQLLKKAGIEIGAHIEALGGIKDSRFDPVNVNPQELERIKNSAHPVINQNVWNLMEQKVLQLKADGDSAGGIIECAAVNLPVGMGSPMFGGVENRLSSALFAVPAVKGVEFGVGFDCADMTGSCNNDEFYYDRVSGAVRTKTNNHGGILGGLTSGMPLIFRAAFKPTPSIAKEQNSISFSEKKDCKLVIEGRHDPCVVLRAVPCVEAAAALALYDMYMEYSKC